MRTIPGLTLLAVLGLGLAGSTAAQGQTAPAAPRTYPTVAAVASLGWYSASEDVFGADGSWYGTSLNRGVGAAFHWTEHIITTADASWSGEGDLYGAVPPSSATGLYQFARHTFRSRQLALGQRYQFGHNAWVHPDVGVGAIVEWAEHGGETFPAYGRNGQVVDAGGPIGPTTERRASVFVSTGLKTYVTRRGFIRTDVRLGIARAVRHVLLNVGFGIDF